MEQPVRARGGRWAGRVGGAAALVGSVVACAAPSEPAPLLVRAEVVVDEARSVGAVIGAPEMLYAARVALARAKRFDEDGQRDAADREAEAAAKLAGQARDLTLAAGLPVRGRLTP